MYDAYNNRFPRTYSVIWIQHPENVTVSEDFPEITYDLYEVFYSHGVSDIYTNHPAYIYCTWISTSDMFTVVPHTSSDCNESPREFTSKFNYKNSPTPYNVWICHNFILKY